MLEYVVCIGPRGGQSISCYRRVGKSISLRHTIGPRVGQSTSLLHVIGPRVGQSTSLLHVIGPRGVIVASCYRRITCIVRII